MDLMLGKVLLASYVNLKTKFWSRQEFFFSPSINKTLEWTADGWQPVKKISNIDKYTSSGLINSLH